MPDQQISLPENVYAAVLAQARAHGLTAADWIASKLPNSLIEEPTQTADEANVEGTSNFKVPPDIAEKPLWELLGGRVGVVSLDDSPGAENVKQVFGDAVIEKLQHP